MNDFADKLKKLIKDEYRLSFQKSDKQVGLNVSRVGGKPAVPKGFVWPRYSGESLHDGETKDRPLSFLAQINLKDVPFSDEDKTVPRKGILSFFYEMETMTWGMYPGDRGSAQVFYFQDDSALMEADCPEDLAKEYLFPAFEVSFTRRISIPCAEDYDEMPDLDYDIYDECRTELGYDCEEESGITKLFGYPDIIQNSMRDELRTVSRWLGVQPDDEWVLLFQMGSVGENFEIMFGDDGYLYFWIRKEDLRDLRFDRIWLIMQCF